MLKDFINILIRQYWIVLILIIALLGGFYSMTLFKMDEELYEIETLPSSFEGEIDFYEPRGANAYARFVHEDTSNDGGKEVFSIPGLDLAPGSYRVSYAVKALLAAGEDPLRIEVIDPTNGQILAAQTTAVHQLNTETYEVISFEFSVDDYSSDAEMRAFLPDQGAYWFDYAKINKLTRSPWNIAYIIWPLLVIGFAAVLVINQRNVEYGVSINTALRNSTPEKQLVLLANFVLLGFGMFSLFSKYIFDIERIVYAYIIDEAFYYFETAAHLARQGKMSFDGITSSNGFHPLWVFLLVPIYWIGLSKETSLLAGLILADVISLAAILLLFWVLRRRFNIFLAFGLTLLLFSLTLIPLQYGLETAVLIGSFVALLALYETRFRGPLSDVSYRDCVLLGLLLGIVVLARLDHAIFAVPFILLFLIFNWRSLFLAEDRKKIALIISISAALVLPYLIYNYVTTGYFVPISGLIKGIWSEEALKEATLHKTYFQAKVESFVMILTEQKDSFWPLVGSLIILWVVLARRRLASFKTLLPFIFGPMMIFGYYIIFFHYPFNSPLWYYPTIWLAGLLTIALAIDMMLDYFQLPENVLFHGILIGGLIVILVFVVVAQINRQRSFLQWARSESFEESYKFLSWRSAEYVLEHIWSPGEDGKVVFASADAGVFSYLLNEPVVNLDGLINNEILDYELQDKQWLIYAVEKLEIDYVVNVFEEEWWPPPLFKEHFIPCYISEDYSKDNISFRIYGRKTALESGSRDVFAAGCVKGMLSSWWAGEKLSGYDSINPNYVDSRIQTTHCAIPLQSDKNTAFVFGSSTTLPAGIYEVDYYLSVDDNSNDSLVAKLDITCLDDKAFTELSIRRDDFETPGEFQRFTIPFRLTKDRDNVQFRVYNIGEQSLCVQGIRLLEW